MQHVPDGLLPSGTLSGTGAPVREKSGLVPFAFLRSGTGRAFSVLGR